MPYSKALKNFQEPAIVDSIEEHVSTTEHLVGERAKEENRTTPKASSAHLRTIFKYPLKRLVPFLVLTVLVVFIFIKFIPKHSDIYENASVPKFKNEFVEKDAKQVSELKEASQQIGADKEALKVDKDPCSLGVESVSNFVPPKASYASNFVYLVSKTEQQVCVIDGQGKKQIIDLKVGEHKNISGVSPFIVLANDFEQLNVFFQGWRARPNSRMNHTLRLEAAKANASSEANDGEFKDASSTPAKAQ